MKKLFKKFGKLKNFKSETEIKFFIEKPEETVERLQKSFGLITKKTCFHQSENGRTVCLVLNEGLLEIHEMLDQELTYVIFTCPNKRIFEKFNKCIIKN